ncbi:hypothetical protein HOD08_04640 [bacterium]|nr:hypothetical protein [bacterium]
MKKIILFCIASSIFCSTVNLAGLGRFLCCCCDSSSDNYVQTLDKETQDAAIEDLENGIKNKVWNAKSYVIKCAKRASIDAGKVLDRVVGNHKNYWCRECQDMCCDELCKTPCFCTKRKKPYTGMSVEDFVRRNPYLFRKGKLYYCIQDLFLVHFTTYAMRGYDYIADTKRHEEESGAGKIGKHGYLFRSKNIVQNGLKIGACCFLKLFTVEPNVCTVPENRGFKIGLYSGFASYLKHKINKINDIYKEVGARTGPDNFDNKSFWSQEVLDAVEKVNSERSNRI